MPKSARMSGRALRSLGIVLGALCAASPALALHKETPGVVRLTRDTSHFHPSTRSWGNYLAFTSSRDLANTGNSTPQIFVFRLFDYVCQRGTPEPGTVPLCPVPPVPYMVQVTNRPGAPDNPSLTEVTPDGTNQWVAFDADGVLGGGAGAASQRRQIFLKNLITQELRQITNAADGDSTHPSVSSLGGLVVFQSTAALAGVPNPSGVPQVFAYELNTRLLRQITFGAGPSTGAITNNSGTLIAFQSTANLLGDGADSGRSQIFWSVYDRRAHSSTLHQLTNGNGSSQNPYLAETDQFIVFDSHATDLPGAAGGPGREIYASSALGASPVTIRRLTDSAHMGDCSYPALVPAADRVAMICTGDPLLNSTTGNRLFVLDFTDLTLFQITGTADVQGPVGANLGEWFLSFASTGNLDGDSNCSYQLNVVDYFAGHWNAATQPGQLPQDVLDLGGTSTNLIGKHTFLLRYGTGGAAPSGSAWSLTTRDGTIGAPIQEKSSIGLVIGAPDEFTHRASIAVPGGEVALPPIRVPNFGAICVRSDGNGTGVIDCDGGEAGGDLRITQDHNTDDTDPACLFGCREGTACQGSQGSVSQTHQGPCPFCLNGTCGPGSIAPGAACNDDTQCDPTAECVNGAIGVCNGAQRAEAEGFFVAGGMQLTIPVRIDISSSAGVDGKFCDATDTYPIRDRAALLRLNSGRTDAVVMDADNLPASSLGTSATGAPFVCGALQAGIMSGARLVGALPILDVPELPGLRDFILSFDLEPESHEDTCRLPCNVDGDCSDGNACNGLETCINGSCTTGTGVPCDDGDVCNGVETCDPTTGACTPGTPCDDGDPCDGAEICSGNTCVPGTSIACADSDACNGTETCDPGSGACLAGTVPNCDDGNPCTDDSCDTALGCVHVPNVFACDDGNACTSGDICQAGTCIGVPAPCDDGDACNGLETCDPSNGVCQPGPPPICDDSNTCTDDSCDPLIGCLYANNNTVACDDANACTTGDSCVDGVCTGAPPQCDDGDACNGLETCDPTSGVCVPGVGPVCNDNNACTDNVCDPGLGCLYANNTDPCDDGFACTSSDACQAGVCTGAPIDCSDNDLCNGPESCDPLSGACQAGVPADCNDTNSCTDDSCDPILGCVHTPNTGACDDGDACTTGDACSAGACTGTATACNDGDACNGVEACDGGTGACVPGTPLNCVAPDTCTITTCDAALGCVNEAVPDAVLCRIDTLLLELTTAAPGDIGGLRRQTRFASRLTTLRHKLEAALARPARRARMVKSANRILSGFQRTLRRGAQQGKYESALATRLITLASEAMVEARQLLAP
jgi:Tol biopolymer transport system component